MSEYFSIKYGVDFDAYDFLKLQKSYMHISEHFAGDKKYFYKKSSPFLQLLFLNKNVLIVGNDSRTTTKL